MQKKYRSGMTLGKFFLHKGHEFLIQTGIDSCEKFTVLVCTLDRESIPGHLRYQWVKQTFPNVNVVHINDNNLPQYPEEHENFWQIWTNLIKENCSDIDCVFASEDYGKTLGDLMGINHVIVDKERKKVPISGTLIRSNPMKHWNFISEYAKPYFVKRFTIIGPESSGKTVLSQLLAKHFDTKWVPEYGRELWEQKNGNLEINDFKTIAIEQNKCEEELCKLANKILICDTDNIVTKVFLDMYFKEHPIHIKNFFTNTINKTSLNYCKYFLLSPDVPAVQDGTRRFLEERQQHFEVLKNELKERNLPFVVLNGNYEQRFQKAIEEIEKYINK